MSTIRVAVLLGGISPERDISIKTGRAVLAHLPRSEFEARGVEILADGRWQVEGLDPAHLSSGLAALTEWGTEVVFPGLHGAFGEDGTVQGLLELAALPYVGSDVAASAICMDKPRSRDLLEAQGISVAPGLEIVGTSLPDAVGRVIAEIGLPAVVKDPLSGSSIDVTLAREIQDLERALAVLLGRPMRRALVEQYIPGVEYTVGVLGNASVGGEVQALPPLRVNPTLSDWCDYETKYAPGGLEKISAAAGDDSIRDLVRDLAVRAHRFLRCDGLTRTDFIVPEDGVPRFLEVNTLPGLTETSLCPEAARAAGISFPELLARLVRMALERHDALRAGAKEHLP